MSDTAELEDCDIEEEDLKNELQDKCDVQSYKWRPRKYAHRVVSSQERRRESWISGRKKNPEYSISSESSSSCSKADDADLQLDSAEWLHNCPVWTEQELQYSIDTFLGNKGEAARRWRLVLETPKESVWATLPPFCYGAAVLHAALTNDASMLKFFLQRGADPCTTDAQHRTVLHYAANSIASASIDCIVLLLQYKIDIDAWDKDRMATPLMCAAASGRVQAVAALLRAGANINAGLGDSKCPNGSTAILWAVRARSAPCLLQLLENGAAVNNPQAYSEAPIHVAAEQGDETCLQILLQYKADVRMLLGTERMSPLHLAAADGSSGCVHLLLEAHANPNCVNVKGQTPLHLAVHSQSVDSVNFLLDAGARHDIADNEYRTPLHVAVIKSSRLNEIIRRLIASGADVNARDYFGYSPLHLAAISENSNAANLLIFSGADLSAKTKGGVSALTFLVRKTPDVIAMIPQRLDCAVIVNDHDAMDADCELQLDFRILVPDQERQRISESGLLSTLIMTGQRKLLQHPVIRAFLHLKWFKVRTLFLVSLCFYATFVAFLTANILLMYLKDSSAELGRNNATNLCGNTTTRDGAGTKTCNTFGIDVIRLITFLFGLVLAIKEVFQFIQSPMEHIRNLENYVQFALVIGVVIINIPLEKYQGLQQHMAAVLVVVAWTELLMHVGRFPIFGLYVQMFQTVAANMAKFLLAYVCLIIGFSLGLAVLFPDRPALSDLPHSLLTTMVMMTGELEYTDYFYGDSKLVYSVTTELIFFAFLLSIVIVLMNLLVGLAVSDIQGLQKSAGLDRLERQALLIARMENIVFSPWLIQLSYCVNLYFIDFLQRKILLVPPNYHQVYTIRPNDPRDDRFPLDVKEGILKILISNQTSKKRPVSKCSSTQSTISNDDLLQQLSQQFTSTNNLVQQHLSQITSQIEVMQNRIDEIIWQLNPDGKFSINNK